MAVKKLKETKDKAFISKLHIGKKAIIAVVIVAVILAVPILLLQNQVSSGEEMRLSDFFRQITQPQSNTNTSVSTHSSEEPTSGLEPADTSIFDDVIVPPVISDITIYSITPDSAIISWVTDQPSSSLVRYGASSGMYTNTKESTIPTTSHSAQLSNLQSDKKYYFVVISSDEAGVTRQSDEMSFTTALDSTVNTIKCSDSDSVLYPTDNQEIRGTVTVGGLSYTDTCLDSTHMLEYYCEGDQDNFVLNNSIECPYGCSLGSCMPQVDDTSPTISNVYVSSITENSATVTWLTDETATSLVKYGTSSSSSYPSQATSSGGESHSVTISGLSASTLYYFVVVSSDSSGNDAQSSERSFTTLVHNTTVPDVTAPSVSSTISPSDITESTTFTIDTSATDSVGLSSIKIIVGGSIVKTCSVSGVSASCSYSSTRTAGTYTYFANATDISGNSGLSQAGTFSVSQSSIGAQSSTCQDSDEVQLEEGVIYPTKNYYVQGGVSINGSEITSPSDTCTSSMQLREYYCSSSDDASYLIELYGCPYGCRSSPNQGRCNQNITLSVSANQTTGITPMRVSFSASATDTPDNDPKTYSWTLPGGNPSTSSSANPSVLYSSPGTYIAQVSASDGKGGSDTKSIQIIVNAPGDTTPPVISNLQSSGITMNEATITWNTNEISSSTVTYTTNPGYYGNIAAGADGIDHIVYLSGLSAETTYYYRVQSSDGANNAAESSEYMFMTLPSNGGGGTLEAGLTERVAEIISSLISSIFGKLF